MRSFVGVMPLVLIAAGGSHTLSAAGRNVVLILGDDYSCGEHGFYGNEIIQTPNLDGLAKESVWFDNFYVGPISSPTRAQLMTGSHEFKGGVTHTKYPRAYLALGQKIMPNYFVEAGYATAHFGKWHLGNDVFDDEYSARARGFQYSIVSDYRDHFDPEMICNGVLVKYSGFREDILFDEAKKWMGEQLEAEQPFFCYIATNSAHSPFGCPREYSDKYEGKVAGQNNLYYGMVDNIDQNVGEVIAYLKEQGIYEETLLIYLSDNGHVYHGGYNAGMRGGKNSEYRGGTRVPCLMHCPDVFEGGRRVSEMAGAIDMLPTMASLLGFDVDRKIDGETLYPLLSGKKEELKERFMVCHTGRWADGKAQQSKYRKYAVQNRRYRLVNNKELYDIERDPGETTNVIDQHPRLVAKMRRFYEKWWAECCLLMVNDALAHEQGGSRLSIEDVAFRKANNQPGPVKK